MDLASTTIHSALALNPIPKAESQLQWLVVHGLVRWCLGTLQIELAVKGLFKSDPFSGKIMKPVLYFSVHADDSRCLGSILVCASQDIGMLIVGRIINGLAVGVSSQTLYICGEILTGSRSALLNVQFTSPNLPHQASVAVLSAPNNGPSLGVS
jgi:MFS family permease